MPEVTPPEHMDSSPSSSLRHGLLAAGGAFLMWGLLPVYWKGLSRVAPLEIIAHRIVWSAVFSALVLTLQGRWEEIRAAMGLAASRWLLLASSALLAVNWFVFIFAVNTGRVVEASLGYYINPLVNVLLGFIFFRDRLTRVQSLAILLAVIGVGNMVWAHGRLPWISLVLAFSFGLFGLVRKVVRVKPLPGLFLESSLLGIPSALFLVYLGRSGTGALFTSGPTIDALLIGAGAITATPLLLFAYGARRLRLTTLGVMQYIAPTGMFLLGVLAYGEPFTQVHLVTFSCIWVGVGLYTWEGVTRFKRSKKHRAASG
ncbi:MAG: EamA family transporter RarD [Desulfohalobiaceae bacterium]